MLKAIFTSLFLFSGILGSQSAQAQAVKTFTECDGCPTMVVVPAGSFKMGRNDGEDGRYEGPVHTVTLKRAFALGQTEVTVAQFKQFVEATGHNADRACRIWTGEKTAAGPIIGYDDSISWRFPGDTPVDDQPVSCMNWEDAKAYVNWMAGKTGRPYRLASEAEWEYAATAGKEPGAYIWGDDPAQACTYANIFDVTGAKAHPIGSQVAPCDDGISGFAPVKSFKPNAFGLFDMTGNVWEWVEDCYEMPYPATPVDGSAQVSTGCDRHGVRGGSWITSLNRQHPEFRGRDPVTLTTWIFGIRIARTLGDEEIAQYQPVAKTLQTARLGNAKKGKFQFIKCRACHTLAPGERHMVGPNLGNLFGGQAGTKEGFGYSDAMRTSGLMWTTQTLDSFIERPQAVVDGTAMIFAGIKGHQQRADLIAYLKENTQAHQ